MPEEIKFIKYDKMGAYHWTNYYGGLSKIDCFLRARYQIVIELLEQNGINKSAKLLEIGSGDGALSGLIYRKFNCHITGVDPSEKGVNYAQEIFHQYGFEGEFTVASGYSFQLNNDSFDFIVLADVLEHLQYPDLMLKEIKRLSKPGGKVIITTPIRTNEHPEDLMHVQEFFPEQLEALCRPFFSKPIQKVYSHPVVWYELYTFGKKRNRSFWRLYCRILDKIFQKNPFLKTNENRNWKNFKQQALVLQKST
ncbi:MAG: hypothetical protein RLZ47_415 [Bacteroidota bacterium]|jgi:ubiquinone/menaquinone biosynthesis C-methylase UbiE